ncbi:MAG TPA: tyrosine-type recombinase/integrase [Propionibacteriaceae bacterium]|jgi:integrase|nr:tyrosine-type recombinase/integrase [Propionibacteriaceae bacterium]
MMAKKAGSRSWGRIKKYAADRYQAAYVGPDMRVHYAPEMFVTKMDAEAWLIEERKLTTRPNWLPPRERAAAELAGLPPTLTEYADGWLASRGLKPRTKALYRRILDRHMLPTTLGSMRLTAITPTAVRAWHTALGPGAPTQRAHAYALLKTILGTAVSEQLITTNPCVIRAGGSAKTVHKAKPATFEELAIIVENMPDRLRLAVLIAAWCGLRMGEIFELRRGDIDLKERVIRIRRAVVRVPGEPPIVGSPKSRAGTRDVSIPPHLLPEFSRHLAEHVPIGGNALLFVGRDSGEQVASSTLYRWYYPAREAAGRPDLRWHDLRHTGATLAAATGATLAALMNRLGHSTVGAAMRYQHAAADGDGLIAEALSRMAQPISMPAAVER